MPIGRNWRMYFLFHPVGIYLYRMVYYAISSPWCSIVFCLFVLLSNIILKWLSVINLVVGIQPFWHFPSVTRRSSLPCIKGWFVGLFCSPDEMGWGADGVISLDVVIFGYMRWGFWDGVGRMVIISYRVFVVILGCRIFIPTDWWCRGAKAVCKYFVKMMILSN